MGTGHELTPTCIEISSAHECVPTHTHINKYIKSNMVVHTFNHSTGEARAGGSLGVRGHPDLHTGF